MDIRQLRHMMAIHRTGSFAKAAEQLGLAADEIGMDARAPVASPPVALAVVEQQAAVARQRIGEHVHFDGFAGAQATYWWLQAKDAWKDWREGGPGGPP